jgi:hypothetical protein
VSRADGRVSRAGGMHMRPGVSIPLRIASSDPSIIDAPQPSVTLQAFVEIPLSAVRPGRAELRVVAPLEITNRAERLETVVTPFRFGASGVDSPTRYLVSRFALTNPRSQTVTVALSSAGATPVRFGTSGLGLGAPSNTILAVDLAPKEQRTVFVEPAGPGSAAVIRMSAPDFEEYNYTLHINEPQVRFDTGPLSVNLASASTTITVILGAGNSAASLGTGFGGPVRVQLQSSNPQVVKVPAAPVEFQPGESRKTAILQLVGRGEAVISLTAPAAFNSGVSQRDFLITVR